MTMPHASRGDIIQYILKRTLYLDWVTSIVSLHRNKFILYGFALESVRRRQVEIVTMYDSGMTYCPVFIYPDTIFRLKHSQRSS
jgi:hypothetical protein